MLILVAIDVFGYSAGALFFGRHLRRSRALTVAEFFGRRFASRRVQAAAGTMIVVWAGYTACTFHSGSRGVVINDTLMFVPFTLAGFIAVGCVLAATGGWSASVTALSGFVDKPGITAWHGVTGPGANRATPGEALTGRSSSGWPGL